MIECGEWPFFLFCSRRADSFPDDAALSTVSVMLSHTASKHAYVLWWPGRHAWRNDMRRLHSTCFDLGGRGPRPLLTTLEISPIFYKRFVVSQSQYCIGLADFNDNSNCLCRASWFKAHRCCHVTSMCPLRYHGNAYSIMSPTCFGVKKGTATSYETLILSSSVKYTDLTTMIYWVKTSVLAYMLAWQMAEYHTSMIHIM